MGRKKNGMTSFVTDTGKTRVKSKFHATQMTQQDVDNGALYMPVGYPAFNENSLMTQNKYWQNTLLTFNGIKIEDYEIYFIKHIHHWHSN